MGVLAAVTGACAANRVAPIGPSLARPVFHLAVINRHPLTMFYGLSVVSCDGTSTYWTFGTGGTTAALPDSVAYGDTPRGYTTVTGPVPLGVGCYTVRLSGGAALQFRVNAAGRVTVAGDSAAVTR